MALSKVVQFLYCTNVIENFGNTVFFYTVLLLYSYYSKYKLARGTGVLGRRLAFCVIREVFIVAQIPVDFPRRHGPSKETLSKKKKKRLISIGILLEYITVVQENYGYMQ